MPEKVGQMMASVQALPGPAKFASLAAAAILPPGVVLGSFSFFKFFLGWRVGASIVAVLIVLAALLVLIAGIVLLRRSIDAARQKSMGLALARAGAEGPQAMGAAADIREMNEKFRRSVEQMRKHGYRVYDMPWFIVVGDSGCGKTKLVNESGLQFPLGRPEEIAQGDREGITIGTKDYNWWFTENMIFIDMAGKLVNPEQESGHRTWLGMLKIISRGRPRCPINGALVCVSVDDLLKPEKRRRDAENMQLRLRELQMHLGVTFPTYLVVTKCDMVPGFVEFFRRVGRDLLLRNQIAGWSRPGEFSNNYDSDSFPAEFDELCLRLHQLRLRRLREDEDEAARENAYGFPEHFRDLGGALREYIATVFPPLRNARGVGQLLFRGVYFTSATQDDKLLTGEGEIAEVMKGLEKLYEKPEPHFLKDLLQRKIAPEQGLVFRNQAQLRRNRNLAIGLCGGTLALAALSVAGFVWSYREFAKVIAQPKKDAAEVRQAFAKAPIELAPERALQLSGRLAEDIDALRTKRGAARLLAMFVHPDGPARDLARIRDGVVEQRLMPLLAQQVRARLDRPYESEEAYAEKDDVQRRQPFDREPADVLAEVAALTELMKWGRAANSRGLPDCLSVSGLRAMAEYALRPGASEEGPGEAGSFWDWAAASERPGAKPASGSEGGAPSSAAATSSGEVRFADCAAEYLESLKARGGEARNPGAAFADGAMLAAGEERLLKRLSDRATLHTFAPGEDLGRIESYINIAWHCRMMVEQRDRFLSRSGDAGNIKALADGEQLVESLAAAAQAFVAELDACPANVPRAPKDALWKALKAHRDRQWGDTLKELGRCGVSWQREESAAALDKQFCAALVDLGWADSALAPAALTATAEGPEAAKAPADFDGFPGRYGYVVEEKGRVYALTSSAAKVREYVAPFAQRVAAGADDTATLDDFVKALAAADNPQAKAADKLDAEATWKTGELLAAGPAVRKLSERVRLSRTLQALLSRLDSAGAWGLAAVFRADAFEPVASAYSIPIPSHVAASAPANPAPGGIMSTEAVLRSSAPAEKAVGDRTIPRAATGEFATDAGIATAYALAYLDEGRLVLGSTSVAQDRLLAAWTVYVDRFAAAWKDASAQVVAAPLQESRDKLVLPDTEQTDQLSRAAEDFCANVLRAGYKKTDKTSGNGNWLVRADLQIAPGPQFRRVGELLHKAIDDRFAIHRDKLPIDDPPYEAWAKEYAKAWGRLRDAAGAVDQLLSRQKPKPLPEGATPFEDFANLARKERFPWAEFPPLAGAVNLESQACGELAKRARSESSRMQSGSLASFCKARGSEDSIFQQLPKYLGHCGIRPESLWTETDNKACATRQDLAKVQVRVELLTEGKLRAFVPNILQAANDDVIDSDFCDRVTLAIGGKKLVFDTHGVYPDAIAAGQLENIRSFEMSLDGPAAGITPQAAASSQQFEDPASDLLLYLWQRPHAVGKDSYTLITAHSQRFSRNQSVGEAYLGVAWTFEGISADQLEQYCEYLANRAQIRGAAAAPPP